MRPLGPGVFILSLPLLVLFSVDLEDTLLFTISCSAWRRASLFKSIMQQKRGIDCSCQGDVLHCAAKRCSHSSSPRTYLFIPARNKRMEQALVKKDLSKIL